LGPRKFGHDGWISSKSLSVLLALVRKSLTDGELPSTFGMSPSELRQLLDRLRRGRFVSTVSEVDGRDERQTLSLTLKGELILLQELEQMCELPER